MAKLRHLHLCMTSRRPVVLHDGRTGRIVRVDTNYPSCASEVTLWTDGPGLTKVTMEAVVGPVAVDAG